MRDLPWRPAHFPVGIEAMRLDFVYRYDRYVSIAVAPVDSSSHQLQALYDTILKPDRIRYLGADALGAGKSFMAGLLVKKPKILGRAPDRARLPGEPAAPVAARHAARGP